MYSDSVKAAATPTSLNRESWRSMYTRLCLSPYLRTCLYHLDMKIELGISKSRQILYQNRGQGNYVLLHCESHNGINWYLHNHYLTLWNIKLYFYLAFLSKTLESFLWLTTLTLHMPSTNGEGHLTRVARAYMCAYLRKSAGRS